MAASKVHTRISLLNKSILHGGNAEIDVLMFKKRHRIEEISLTRVQVLLSFLVEFENLDLTRLV